MSNTRTTPSRSFGEIGRLASRALAIADLPELERHDLEEILQIARRGRSIALPTDDDELAGTGPGPVGAETLDA